MVANQNKSKAYGKRWLSQKLTNQNQNQSHMVVVVIRASLATLRRAKTPRFGRPS